MRKDDSSLTDPRKKPVLSSGVGFFPPSCKYWRIGRKWYDFAPFLKKHPGGARVLTVARDRFEDCTFVFEAHHHDYARARAIIAKYEVPEEILKKEGLLKADRFPSTSDEMDTPKLMGDDSFYSVIRRRVTKLLKESGCPDGGPSVECIVLFWVTFVTWATLFALTYSSGSFLMAAALGFAAAWLGAFGHNWVHQPKYRTWAYLSLDMVGFSSEAWFRDHLLQHHMYTNTKWDNHYHGTDPFLVTDPSVERNWLQANVMPFINPILLCFGVYANWIGHSVEILTGREEVDVFKFILPLQVAIMMSRWGVLHGAALIFTCYSVVGVYYFTMALMNHNAEHCHQIKRRNESVDWGEAQLHSSADWGVNMPFLAAGIYLWLNYHTVHHLFPKTDMSHHPAIQRILVDTCREFGIKYVTGHPLTIYLEMVRSFSTPLSLFQSARVYGGGL